MSRICAKAGKALLLALLIMAIYGGVKGLPLAILRINSGSMEPALRTGSFVVVKRGVEFKELEPGNVVVFSRGEGLVCHRIIKKEGDFLVTKGDANEFNDPVLVTKESVYGVCLFVD